LLCLTAVVAEEDDIVLLQRRAKTMNPGARCCASEKQMAKESDYAYAKCSCMGVNAIAVNEPKISQRSDVSQAQCGTQGNRDMEWCEYPQGACPYGFFEGDFASDDDKHLASHLRARSCNMNPLVEVTGDPHMRNLNGELFDLSKEGEHVLIQIPAGSGSDLEVTGTVSAFHKERKCPKFFMTQLKMKGKLVGEESVQIISDPETFGVKVGSSTELLNIDTQTLAGVAKVQRCSEDILLCKSTSPSRRTPNYANKVLVQLPSSISIVASNYASANPSFMNLAVSGLAAQDDVGGLLGHDDHSMVAGEPECEVSSTVQRVSMLQREPNPTVGHLTL